MPYDAVYWKTSTGKTFTVFPALNRQSLSVNHGLVDQQYNSTERLYSESFTANSYFPLKM